MAGKRVFGGLCVLFCLLFGTCSLGTDIETLRGNVKNKTGSGPGPDGNELPATSGSVTFTGLSDYNGKYAVAITLADPTLFAVAGFNYQTQTLTGGKINNGSVTLKVWKDGANENEVQGYSGNDKDVDFVVIISDTASFNVASTATGYGNATVSFTAGKGSGTFSSDFPL